MSGQAIAKTELDQLAIKANAEHRQVEGAVNSALYHARNAGEILIEAKQQCPHGTWQDWITQNFEGSVRTAQAYMRVARGWPELAASKTQGLAHLTYEDALKALADPRDEPAPVSEPVQRIPDEPDPTNEPEYMYDKDDDIAQFTPEKKKTRRQFTYSPPQHPCKDCGEIFDRPMWHCKECDEHYVLGQPYCPECNPPAKPDPKDDPYEFNLLADARYTLSEARDLLGADTSPGGMVNGLIRNLDDVVKNIRRWRGEQV